MSKVLFHQPVLKRRLNYRCISTSDFIGTEQERFRFWTKAKPMVLSLLVGSMALQIQWCKEAYNDYMRETDTRMQLLNDQISAVKAQLDGKELHQNQVPRGILFGVSRTKLDLPESKSISSKKNETSTLSESRFL